MLRTCSVQKSLFDVGPPFAYRDKLGSNMQNSPFWTLLGSLTRTGWGVSSYTSTIFSPSIFDVWEWI